MIGNDDFRMELQMLVVAGCSPRQEQRGRDVTGPERQEEIAVACTTEPCGLIKHNLDTRPPPSRCSNRINDLRDDARRVHTWRNPVTDDEHFRIGSLNEVENDLSRGSEI